MSQFSRPGGGRFGRGRPGPSHSQRRHSGPRREGDEIVVLYGWHPVAEALRNPRRTVLRIIATENGVRRLREEGIDVPVEPEIVRPGDIDRLLTPDAVHQGLYLEALPLEAPELDAFPGDALVLVLDQITDPHNVGAMLRTAAAFNVAAVITTNRHSPSATGVLAKSASGGLEHVPIKTVQNLARAIEELKDAGFTCIGFDSEAEQPLEAVKLQRPLALVMGAEGKGLRQKTRETCSALARLDMPGAIKSLNVSNATAIALWAATHQKG